MKLLSTKQTYRMVPKTMDKKKCRPFLDKYFCLSLFGTKSFSNFETWNKNEVCPFCKGKKKFFRPNQQEKFPTFMTT